jgi:hypothetical protein
VLFDLQRAGAGNLDDIGAPLAFRAMQLDIGTPAAHARPVDERQILDPGDADAAEYRQSVGLHELVIIGFRLREFSKSGMLFGSWFVPVNRPVQLVHSRLFMLANKGAFHAIGPDYPLAV